MSNPFATFRKNQTYWMAGLVLVAILAFIVAPAIDMITNRNRGVVAGDPTVVAYWNGGQITRKEIEESLRRRVGLRNFLAGVAKKVIAAGGKPNVPGFANSNGNVNVRGINDSISEDAVCYGKILMSMADRIGVEFDDEAADSFLKSFCDRKISDADFAELLKNSGITIHDARQIIKQDLTTSTTLQLLAGGESAPTPDQLWQNFLKISQQAKVEAYPIHVSSYMDKVSKKPTETQLQELYEAGKATFEHPDLPTAGFARREKFNIEYVESNYKAWSDREKAKVTELEMKDEYNRQVAAGLLKVPVDYKAPETELPTAVPSNPGAAAPANPATSSETPATTAPPTTANPTTTPVANPEPAAPTTPPVESPAPATPAPSGTPEQPAPSTPEPATGVSPGSEPAKPAEPTNPQGARVNSSTEVRLVSFVQEESAPATSPAEPSTTPPPTQETAPANPAPAEPATGAPTVTTGQQPPATTPTAPPAVETTTPVTTTPAAAPATNPQTTTEEPLATAVPTTPPMRDMTYEEARDRILNYLADSRAREASGAASAALQKAMEEYSTKYRQYESLKSANLKDKKIEKPNKPDLKKFAADNGLIYSETGSMDQVKLAVTPFGGSFSQGGIVANLAGQLPVFYPLVSFSMDGSTYTYWKTESTPAEVPKFSEVRDNVEDWWKRIEARKLAEEAANNMAKKLGTGEDPWAAASLSQNERSLVVTTDPFTWMSRMGGQPGAQPGLTPVPKLERVGMDFMKQVFSTDAGKFGVASNNPKSIYYVVRVLEKNPDNAELQKRFSEDPLHQTPRQLANSDPLMIDWQALVNKELNVQWQ